MTKIAIFFIYEQRIDEAEPTAVEFVLVLDHVSGFLGMLDQGDLVWGLVSFTVFSCNGLERIVFMFFYIIS